jgi:DNA repair photolyase
MIQLRIARHDLPESLKSVIDYRKSGLSLNHIVGCPLDCAYCVRHLFDNFEMKKPHLVIPDEAAVDQLVGHWAFRAGSTPVQIFNRATDPFLPGVKDHLFVCLERLDRLKLTNPILIITRWRVGNEDVARLEKLQHLKVTVLVTWSGIEELRLEPVDSAIAEGSLAVLAAHSNRTKSILYWRPIISGINDSDDHLRRARELSALANATVFTGLFYRDEIRRYFASVGIPDPYEQTARRKILPAELEKRILEALSGLPLFRKTSCGVAYAHRMSDYNGHYGIREICDICPAAQMRLCGGAHRRPGTVRVREVAIAAGLEPSHLDVNDRRIEVAGSTEQQRYFMQHSLNFQVHDQAKSLTQKPTREQGV